MYYVHSMHLSAFEHPLNVKNPQSSDSGGMEWESSSFAGILSIRGQSFKR